MQRPPLFESDSFIYWKNRFETYVKSKDLDLWHVITNGDFQPIVQNPETKLEEVIPFEKQTDDLKKRLKKNNEAKGNSQVKDNKIDLLVQQYEQFVISEDESIDSAFARFNTIITSLKALDEVHEMIIKKELQIVKAKVKRKSITLKAKKEYSNEECLTSGSEDEEYAMTVRDFKKFFKRRVENRQNHRKLRTNELYRSSWCVCGEEDDEKVKDETCLVAHASSEVCSESSYFSDENSSIDDLALDNKYE
ncbi:hypothetical protein Tco_0579072 [Tanacetum coccineum]